MSRRAKIESLININETTASKILRNRFKDNNFYFHDDIDNVNRSQKINKLR